MSVKVKSKVMGDWHHPKIGKDSLQAKQFSFQERNMLRCCIMKTLRCGMTLTTAQAAEE